MSSSDGPGSSAAPADDASCAIDANPAHQGLGDCLAGLRVLDLTRLLPGPLAARHLAEWGAEVVKIDDPGTGDAARHLWQSDGDREAGRDSAFYRDLNRGKQALRIDLRSDAGRDRLMSLVDGADALLEGFRPGVMARLGLGWNELHARNPRLVLASITGYGQHGAWAQRAGHDINYTALSGVLGQIGTADGAIALPNFQIADLLGGTLAATSGLLAALLGAQRTGRGRHVDIAMAREVWRHAVVARAEGAAARATVGREPGPGRAGREPARWRRGLLRGLSRGLRAPPRRRCAGAEVLARVLRCCQGSKNMEPLAICETLVS